MWSVEVLLALEDEVLRAVADVRAQLERKRAMHEVRRGRTRSCSRSSEIESRYRWRRFSDNEERAVLGVLLAILHVECMHSPSLDASELPRPALLLEPVRTNCVGLTALSMSVGRAADSPFGRF